MRETHCFELIQSYVKAGERVCHSRSSEHNWWSTQVWVIVPIARAFTTKHGNGGAVKSWGEVGRAKRSPVWRLSDRLSGGRGGENTSRVTALPLGHLTTGVATGQVDNICKITDFWYPCFWKCFADYLIDCLFYVLGKHPQPSQCSRNFLSTLIVLISSHVVTYLVEDVY